jgi:hypothetical protein
LERVVIVRPFLKRSMTRLIAGCLRFFLFTVELREREWVGEVGHGTFCAAVAR